MSAGGSDGEPISRRAALTALGIGVAGLALPRHVLRGAAADPVVAGRPVELDVRSLSAMPLYVCAGAVIPLGRVRRWAEAPSDEPTTLVVHPGADGASSLYDDDGHTFDDRRGAWTRIAMTWRDAGRRLSRRLAPGARLLGGDRRFAVRVAGSDAVTSVTFRGAPVEVRV